MTTLTHERPSGLLARFAYLVRATFGSFVRHGERQNPAAVYETAIDERTRQYRDLKEAVAGILYMRNKLEAEIHERRVEIARLHDDAKHAIRRGQDQLYNTADDSQYWNNWIASVDSDGDGWSNGQEVGDPFARCQYSGGVLSCSSGPLAAISAPGGVGAGTLPNEQSNYDMCQSSAVRTDCVASISTCSDASTATGHYACTCASGERSRNSKPTRCSEPCCRRFSASRRRVMQSHG